MHKPAAWGGRTLQGAQHHVLQLDAYNRHRKFVNDYVIHYGGGRPKGWKPPVEVTTDADVLRQVRHPACADLLLASLLE
jgi:hypothetical protein